MVMVLSSGRAASRTLRAPRGVRDQRGALVTAAADRMPGPGRMLIAGLSAAIDRMSRTQSSSSCSTCWPRTTKHGQPVPTTSRRSRPAPPDRAAARIVRRSCRGRAGVAGAARRHGAAAQSRARANAGPPRSARTGPGRPTIQRRTLTRWRQLSGVRQLGLVRIGDSPPARTPGSRALPRVLGAVPRPGTRRAPGLDTGPQVWGRQLAGDAVAVAQRKLLLGQLLAGEASFTVSCTWTRRTRREWPC